MKRRFRENTAGAVGIIGGADGPTSIFIGAPNHEWGKTLEKCRHTAMPRNCRVTGDELAKHLIEEYGAYKVPVSNGKRLALKMTVLMNEHSEALAQSPMPSQDAGLEAWKAWAEQTGDIEAARNIPDEQYGLRYLFLAMPRTEKTERFYAEAEREQEPPKSFWERLIHRKKAPTRTRKMIFGIELSTGYCQLDDGCSSLMNEVTLWRGVTREDIEFETPAFMAYAAAMRDEGRL